MKIMLAVLCLVFAAVGERLEVSGKLRQKMGRRGWKEGAPLIVFNFTLLATHFFCLVSAITFSSVACEFIVIVAGCQGRPSGLKALCPQCNRCGRIAASTHFHRSAHSIPRFA